MRIVLCTKHVQSLKSVCIPCSGNGHPEHIDPDTDLCDICLTEGKVVTAWRNCFTGVSLYENLSIEAHDIKVKNGWFDNPEKVKAMFANSGQSSYEEIKLESEKLPQHLKSVGGTDSLHFAHLFKHVSAYAPSPEMESCLLVDLHNAVKEAKSTGKFQMIDQSGDMFFMVYPTGQIHLCLPWQKFEFKSD